MSFFRSKRNSIITVGIFGIIILSFIFWGGQKAGSASSSTLVTVNGEDIPNRLFFRRLNQERQMFSQYMGSQQKLNDELNQLIERKVATSLVMRKLLVQEAHKLGIRIGADEILETLKKETAFQDPKLKRFSPIVYQSVLQANELDPREFEQDLADDLAADRLRGLIEQTISVSESEVQDHARLQSAQFDLSILTFDPTTAAAKKLVSTTESQAKAYFEGHKSEFLSTEKRTFKVASLDVGKLQRTFKPNDIELKNYFETVIKKSKESPLGVGEQAHALHILISDPSAKGFSKAQDLMKKIRTEDDFRNAAQFSSEDYSNASEGGDLGYFGRNAMVKPFSEAAFTKAKIGQVYGPVKTDYGHHLIWLMDKTSDSQDYSARQKQIAYLYLKEKTAAKTKEILEGVKAARSKDDAKFNQFLESKGFSISETEALDRKSKSTLPYLVLQEGLKAPKDQWQEPQEVGKKIIVVKVTQIIPPTPLSFAEAKDQVVARLESEGLETFVKNLYAELVSGKKSLAETEKISTSHQTLKGFKSFATQLAEPIGSSDVLTKAAQELSTASRFSAPMMHEGKWIILASENWKDGANPSKDALSKAEKEALSRKRASFFESYSNRLVKAAKIPEDFKKRYNI